MIENEVAFDEVNARYTLVSIVIGVASPIIGVLQPGNEAGIAVSKAPFSRGKGSYLISL